jgi:MoaA/NifB/PqqE/SkfB family radical SAM enzyme
MRTARVVTNETCNQRCAFCVDRRAHESRDVAAFGAVVARIEAAKGADVLVLTGGEPLLRRDLPLLVRRAREAASEVELETNAALIDDARATELARAGLARARVHLPAWGQEADSITRDPGGFSRAIAGIEALLRADVRVAIAAPITRSTEAHLPPLPLAVMASTFAARIEALVLHQVVEAPNDAQGELLSLAEAARVVTLTAAAARSVGLAVQLAPTWNLPPCMFARPGRTAHLHALSPGGAQRENHRQIAACAGCSVRDRCPGFPMASLAREPALATTVRPVTETRVARRLSIVGSVREHVEREVVTHDTRRNAHGESVPEAIVRVVFQCNQACTFCFVATHLPPAEDARITREIQAIGALRGVLTLSGGEPLLCPDLIRYVRLGKAAGAREIELQTNAILIDEARAADLVEAGVDTFFVSLHAPRADVSDAITEAPGTFERTRRGLDAIAKTGGDLRLNYVVCASNHALIEEHVRLVAARWPVAELSISFVAPSTDLVPRDASLIPRYTDALPAIRRAVALAAELGVRITGFESMCGLPLCLAPTDPANVASLPEITDDRGEFVRGEACASCDVATKCWGLRSGYAAIYGTSELTAIALAPA